MRTLLFSMFFVCLTVPALASPTEVAPDQVIRDVTRQLLDTVESARNYYDSDPQQYFDKVSATITPIVDFYSFSRGVMGQWGSTSFYNSLPSDEARSRFDGQVDRFVTVFRGALIETYGKGLMAFGGEKIDVADVGGADLEKGDTYVIQTISSDDGSAPHVIRYKMKRDDDAQWRVRNVILDEINLGKVYRNQFASAVQRYDGNIDKVIDNWRSGGIEDDSGTEAGKD